MVNRETLEVGTHALEKLDLLISELTSAKNLGTWDIFFGGSAVTWMKRNRIRKCETVARDTKAALSTFKDMLNRDNSVHLDSIDIFEDTRCIDYFLGIIGNIMVQKKIETNLTEANKTRSALAHCLCILENGG